MYLFISIERLFDVLKKIYLLIFQLPQLVKVFIDDFLVIILNTFVVF